MSLQSKVSAVRQVVGAYKAWTPIEKIYASLRDSRIELYDKAQPAKLPSSQTLQARATAVSTLGKNTNALKFPVSEELRHPDGNPSYYTTIMREAVRENKKSSTFTAIKETTWGWFK